MHSTKNGSRNHDGNPMVALAHHTQQGTEDGATEDNLLGQWCQDAYSHIPPGLFEQPFEYAACGLVHFQSDLLIHKLKWNHGTQSKQSYPKKSEPRFGQQIVARDGSPLGLQKNNQGNHTAEHRGKGKQHGIVPRKHGCSHICQFLVLNK